ncbi:MAG: class III poly(R)-hydroxyalkanoic acid synthase subunit PhaC [Thermoplasmata archaeon]
MATRRDESPIWPAEDAAKWSSFLQLIWKPPKVDVGSTPKEVVWKKDKVELLHYHSVSKKKTQPPLLIAYALINKPYILDLEPGRSVIESFLKKGLDVYMIDWGSPGEEDRYLSTEDYVEGYMNEAVDWILKSKGFERISLMGYCIGGTLASIYTSIHPDKIQNLIIMAGPIEFHCDGSLLHIWTAKEFLDGGKLADAFGIIPIELFTWTFKLLDPVRNLHLKYLDLWENADNEKFAETFFRMEKWIHDGVPMTGAFYKELIENWYQGNQLVSGDLRIYGKRVDLREISMPVLTITGSRDHIVPPESTEALLEFVSSEDKYSIRNNSGHIGLSVGRRAHKEVWPKVANWLRKRSG